MGPDTTLLVTDVENSTTLFEELEAGVMDQAMAIHHALVRALPLSRASATRAAWTPHADLFTCVPTCAPQMRALCLKHNGYEHNTEGDSFLLAFHTPRDAVLFSADLQVRWEGRRGGCFVPDVS